MQNASSPPSGFVADIEYVVNYFDSFLTNDVTFNIEVSYPSGAGSQVTVDTASVPIWVENSAALTVNDMATDLTVQSGATVDGEDSVEDGATVNDATLSVPVLNGELTPEGGTVGASIIENAGIQGIIDTTTIYNVNEEGSGPNGDLTPFADATNTDSVTVTDIDIDTTDTAPTPLIYIGSNAGEAVNAMVEATNIYSAAGATVGMNNIVGDGASLTVDNYDSNSATPTGFTNSLDIVGGSSVPTNIESSNWSGAVITAPSGESFSTVSATWVVPTVSQVPLTGVTLTDMAEWVGIDGYNSSDVCQAGVLETVQTSGGQTTISISAWVEWYPADAILISASSFQVNAGNTIKVTVETTGAGATTATFILDDETTGQIYDTNLTAPAGTKLEGNSAEFIVETPELISGNQVSQPLLSDFLNSPVVFENDSATYANGSSVSLSSAQSIGMWTDDVPGSQGSSVQEAYGSIASSTVRVTEDDYWGGSTSTSNGPTLTAIVDSPSSGDLNAGKTVTITLDWNEVVTVAGGVPTLTLNDGGTATYSSGSGSDALIFSYTVAATDTSVASLAVTAINLNGGTVVDGAGNNANLSLSGLSQTGPQIDTLTPTVTSVVESPNTGDLNAGHVVSFTVVLSEAVTVANGTPTLSLNDGGTATYSGGSGDELNFSYTVLAGQTTNDLVVSSINLNGAAIADAAGNNANMSLAGLTQSGPEIGAFVTSIVETPRTGELIAGDVVSFTVAMSEAVTVANGTPTLSLNDGGTAIYSGASGDDLNFSYTVLAGQNTSELVVSSINLNGATITDAAGSNANLSLTGLSQSGPQIDTTPPTVAVAINSGDVNLANDIATVTFSFSAAPSTFTLADTSAIGGALSNLQEVNATTYTATFTGAANTDISNATVSVTAGSWEEANGNPGAGGSTSSFVVDTVTPTVAVAINSSNVNLANDAATVTFTFSEAPTMFTLADTSAVGGALSNLQEVNGTTYTATFAGAVNTDISNATVSVIAGSWEEVNGNPGAAGSTIDFTVNTVTPAVNVNSFTVGTQQSVAASSFLTISNPNGDNITEYSFEDIGGNGHFTVAGSVEPAGQQFTVSASNLGNVQYVGGSSAGTDTIVIDAYDATIGAWLPLASLNAVTMAPFPLANVSDVTEALYIGYFGRAADPGGDAYWLNQLSSGQISELGMAASFSVQAEATALYPFLANPSTATQAQITSFIESVYGDLFDRAADAGGLAYWQNYLTANLGNPQVVGAFVLTVINGALGADQVTISNKVTVADYFTQQLGLDGISFTSSADSLAHTVIASVTSSASTVLAAESTINTWLATEVALLGTSHTSEVSGVAHI